MASRRLPTRTCRSGASSRSPHTLVPVVRGLLYANGVAYDSAVICRSLWLLASLSALACVVGNQAPAPESARAGNAAAQVEAQLGLVRTPVARYVANVGGRLAERSPRRDVRFEFHVLDVPEPNAFALAGGNIYVSRGLVALLNSEDELANVIAHEVGHVAAQHHAKSARRRLAVLPVNIVVGLGAMATSIVSPMLGEAVSALGTAPTQLALATYSRGQEREADEIGQGLAAAAGWDPAAMAAVMTTLAREEELSGRDPAKESFFASHPTSPDRAAVTARYAAALSRGSGAPIAAGRRAFLERLVGLDVGPSASSGVFVGARFLHPELEFALALPDGWTHQNTPRAVGAVSPDGSSAVLLTLSAEDGALEAGRVMAAAKRVDFEAGPETVRVGGLRAARALAHAGAGGDRVTILLHWVELGGNVFQIAGLAPAARFARERASLARSAESFRPLSATERGQILQSRLRLIEAAAGETFAQIVRRTGSTWSAEEMSTANGLTAAAVPARRAVKVALPEPYLGR